MCKTCTKIMTAVFILIALALAIAVSVWHEQVISYIAAVGRFFDVMIPVLAVGALLKYLISDNSNSCCHDKKD